VLSSESGAPAEPNRERTEELIRELNLSIAKIDPAKLDSSDIERRTVAASLVQSAQKALQQNDYLEANSLAMKASMMLAPLTGGPQKVDF
jgi:hypothetical protein